MKRVRVLTLHNCEHCKQFKEALKAANTVYEDLDADDNSDLADSVEELLTTYQYPIVIIEEGKETTFVYNTEDGSKLGPRRLAANVVAIGCFDVEAMLNNVFPLIK